MLSSIAQVIPELIRDVDVESKEASMVKVLSDLHHLEVQLYEAKAAAKAFNQQ